MPAYMCQLCANHGQFYQPKKGHKRKCPHRECTCSLCELNSRRRALDRFERRIRGVDSGSGTTSAISSTSISIPTMVSAPILALSSSTTFPSQIKSSAHILNLTSTLAPIPTSVSISNPVQIPNMTFSNQIQTSISAFPLSPTSRPKDHRVRDGRKADTLLASSTGVGSSENYVMPSKNCANSNMESSPQNHRIQYNGEPSAYSIDRLLYAGQSKTDVPKLFWDTV